MRAAIPLLLLVLSACAAKAGARPQDSSIYRCAGGQSFSVDQGEETAEVVFNNERFRLARRSSGIGVRYASDEATLIIDGDLAAFATQRIVGLRACRAIQA